MHLLVSFRSVRLLFVDVVNSFGKRNKAFAIVHNSCILSIELSKTFYDYKDLYIYLYS